MEEAVARRKAGGAAGEQAAWAKAGFYEMAFRVLGRYMDEEKPRDVFFFEQGGAFVVRLLMGSQQGSHHTLAEFTREDIEAMIAKGPALRHETKAAAAPGTGKSDAADAPAATGS
jgi:hypothetical protein